MCPKTKLGVGRGGGVEGGGQKQKRCERSTYTWNILLRTTSILNEAISDLPRKHTGTFPLQSCNPSNHVCRRHSRLTTPDGLGVDGTRLVEPTQNLGHAPIGHLDIETGLLGLDC